MTQKQKKQIHNNQPAAEEESFRTTKFEIKTKIESDESSEGESNSGDEVEIEYREVVVVIKTNLSGSRCWEEPKMSAPESREGIRADEKWSYWRRSSSSCALRRKLRVIIRLYIHC